MENKEIVARFYEIVFNGHNHDKVADFLKEDYIQHNPGVRTGREGFMSFIREFHQKNPPDFRLNIKRMIAEGDYVVVHLHADSKSAKLQAAVVDIYRIEDGKLAEHWDVVQPVPKESANTNTMF